MAQNTQPARGMRDFLPSDIRKRNYVINIIKSVYESYGFEPLETPAVENIETLLGKYGEEGNQLIFKILKRGEKLNVNDKELADLALRYDLTVPLARVAANYKNELPKFFKRYQIQPVWRADRPARGRFREFYQCDVDAIGSKSMIVEAELISAVCEILEKLGFNENANNYKKKIIIRINNRKILAGILETVGVEIEKHTDTLIALDKLDKIGSEGVLNELENRGISENISNKLIDFFKGMTVFPKEVEAATDIKLQDENISVEDKNDLTNRFNETMNLPMLEKLEDFLQNSEIGRNGVSEIKNIRKFILPEANLRIRIDPSLARGLSYYTGAIFEINVPDLAGSLGGGGRYDGLIGMFGKEEIPACGFSLGLERILVVMNERGMFPPEIEKNAADVLVTIWNEESIGDSLKLASELREQGLRVFVYPEADKIGKQFKYATTIGAKFVCILGDEEREKGLVALKNLATGEQESVKREDVAEKIKS